MHLVVIDVKFQLYHMTLTQNAQSNIFNLSKPSLLRKLKPETGRMIIILRKWPITSIVIEIVGGVILILIAIATNINNCATVTIYFDAARIATVDRVFSGKTTTSRLTTIGITTISFGVFSFLQSQFNHVYWL